ncbi:sterol desaturase family protein [Novosphingobium huizhouense]|uniref:sterol desaturase family protein n=1 Tax=Novosphingobium huizhouense TaxID=2866625 RepID=UPI001CD90D2C|nr:sterol desaturase family protein [Novosphingobium huizhouense]
MLASVRTTLINLIPPAMVAAFLLFWAYGPKDLLANPWTLVVCTALVTISVLGLEFVFERHEGWRMNRREFFTDLYYVVLSSTVIAWMTQTFAEAPLQSLKTALGIHTPWVGQLPWLAQVALAVFVIEFGQYWMHRLMHNWTPFWLTHAPHHHLTQLNAAKGAVGNPIELFLITLSVLAFFDFDQTALFACFTTTAVVSTFAHANVKSNPPIWYSFFFTTIRHHSLHHSTDYESTRCNYGNSLILLDRIFGTYKEGEGVLVGQDERRRLSIWEQTVFPFQPLVDRYKARKAAAAAAASAAVPGTEGAAAA